MALTEVRPKVLSYVLKCSNCLNNIVSLTGRRTRFLISADTIFKHSSQFSSKSNSTNSSSTANPKAKKDYYQPHYNQGLPGKGKSARYELDAFPSINGEILFGMHPVLLALRAERREKIHTLYIDRKFLDAEYNGNLSISEILERVKATRVQLCPVRKIMLDQLSGNRPHQGVCLDASVLKIPEWSVDTHISLSPDNLPLWLLLHNVQDPMNMGAVLRTACYLGLDKVVVPYTNSCRLSSVVSKASAGAMELVDLVRLPKDVPEVQLCQWWQSLGWSVVGTAVDSSDIPNTRPVLLQDFTINRPTMLIMGNEGIGLPHELVEACDTLVTIPSLEPSHLPVGSLNVSVAAGILLHWMKTSALKVV